MLFLVVLAHLTQGSLASPNPTSYCFLLKQELISMCETVTASHTSLMTSQQHQNKAITESLCLLFQCHYRYLKTSFPWYSDARRHKCGNIVSIGSHGEDSDFHLQLTTELKFFCLNKHICSFTNHSLSLSFSLFLIFQKQQMVIRR